jgi:hypothetical protein
MTNKNDLSPPIGELNPIATKTTQIYSRSNFDSINSAIAMSRGITTDSIGFGHYDAKVVGVVLEPTDVDPNSVNIAGYDISITKDFAPSSVPYGYIVNIPELKGSLMEMPNPNSSAYIQALHALIQSGFLVKVRPSQSIELAAVGNTVEVSFTYHGPPHRGGQYIGNISHAIGMVPIGTSGAIRNHDNGLTFSKNSNLDPNHALVKKAKRFFKNSPIPTGTIIDGEGYKEIKKYVDKELEIWDYGIKTELDPTTHPRLAEYWIHVNFKNTKSQISKREPWSAAFISWVLRDADFVGAGSHWRYSERNQSTANWKGYSLLGDHTGKIKLSLGDVLIKTRGKGTPADRFKTHGDVVFDIQGSHAKLAGGNLGNSAKHTTNITLNRNGTIADPQAYIFILKRKPYEINNNVASSQ